MFNNSDSYTNCLVATVNLATAWFKHRPCCSWKKKAASLEREILWATLAFKKKSIFTSESAKLLASLKVQPYNQWNILATMTFTRSMLYTQLSSQHTEQTSYCLAASLRLTPCNVTGFSLWLSNMVQCCPLAIHCPVVVRSGQKVDIWTKSRFR